MIERPDEIDCVGVCFSFLYFACMIYKMKRASNAQPPELGFVGGSEAIWFSKILLANNFKRGCITFDAELRLPLSIVRGGFAEFREAEKMEN